VPQEAASSDKTAAAEITASVKTLLFLDMARPPGEFNPITIRQFILIYYIGIEQPDRFFSQPAPQAGDISYFPPGTFSFHFFFLARVM
jgi:hypothetical protein